MRRRFPSSFRILITATLSLVLIAGTGLAFTNVSASVFPGVTAGIGSVFSFWWSPSPATGASVSTDKADYSPGETVQITGSGFGANDVVTLKVTDVGPAFESFAQASGYGTWTVNADSSGSFNTSWLVGSESLNRQLLLTADGAPSGLHAQTTFTDGAIGGYDQCSNSPDGDGYDSPPGEGCKWINGNLNASKSSYPEGTATVQRVELTGFGPNENHSVTFQYGTTKNGKHAYDFLTSWNWSEDWISEADRCEGISGCVGLPDVKTAIPHDTALDSFTNGGVTWENQSVSPATGLANQPREFWMRGATYQVTPVTGPTPDVGDYSGTSETLITVNFTTPAAGQGMCTSGGNPTCRVVIWFGAHVARSVDWQAENQTTGAGGISGSPYHVATFRLDDASIGNRDNQMQANAVVSQSLEVKKVLVPAADPGRFDLRIDAGQAGQVIAANQGNGGSTGTVAVSAGNHNVSEIGGTTPATNLSDYTTTLSCVTTNDQGVEQSPVNYGATTSQSVPVGSGEIVVCTFTNTKKATVTIVKDAIPDNAQDFTFNTTGTGPSGWSPSFVLDDDGAGGSATPATRTFTFDSTQLGAKTVTEVAVNNWVLSTLVCSEGTTDTLTGVASFTVDAGDAITCTYTNRNRSLLTGHIIVDKVTNPSGSSQSFEFDPSYNGSTNFFLTDAATPNDSGELDPGTYSVSEINVPTGWSLGSVVCNSSNGNVEDNTAIVLTATEVVTCVFTNTQDAKLTVTKVTNPANSGADSFPFTVTGQTGFSLDTNGADATNPSTKSFTYHGSGYGSVTIDEGATTGWTPTNLVCTAGQSTSIDIPTGVAVVTVDPGDDITCTYTNTKNAKLTIVKVTNPASDPQDFSFTGTGSGMSNFVLDTDAGSAGTLSSQVFNFNGSNYGSKSVVEAATTGWTLTGVSCGSATDSDASLAGVTVDIQPGADVTCTYTNTKNAKLTIVKVTNPANSGADSFPFTVTGQTGFSLDTNGGDATNPSQKVFDYLGTGYGSITIDEGATTGWVPTDLVCTAGQSTSIDIATGVAVVTVDPGDDITCTYTNSRLPKLRLQKVTVLASDPGRFDLLDGATVKANDVGNGGDSGFFVTTIGSHTVSEVAGTSDPATDLNNYVSKVECNSSKGSVDPGTSLAISLDYGDEVTCVFTNKRKPRLTIVKMITGDPASFDFLIDRTGTSPVDPVDLTLDVVDPDGSASDGPHNIAVGDHNVQEVNIPDNWILTGAECTNAADVVISGGTLPNVTFAAGYGDDITCTFVNNQLGGTTRTQGFWATHTILTNTVWNGGDLPEGTSGQLDGWQPVIGSPDAKLCTANDITAIPSPGLNQVMGGFWSNIANKSGSGKYKGGKRSDLDKARMQFLQQYLAAVLNVHLFGTPLPSGYSLSGARDAYCNATAEDMADLLTYRGVLAGYNEDGDLGVFTPGANATAQESRLQANIMFWDITFR